MPLTQEASDAASFPLIVSGMHRSGTSLAAALLQSAGVHMGERLMEANWSNPRGHFEDMDFVDLHVSAFERLGRDRDGWDLREVDDFPTDLVAHAHWLVDRNRTRGRFWGWKDPRGTLFARLWCRVIPDAKLVIVFRAPWDVVDSLYRRGDPVFASDPELAVRAWIFYNRCLYRLAVEMPERCVIAAVDDITAAPASWVEAVAGQSGLPLRTPDAGVAEPLLLHGASAGPGRSIIEKNYPEAGELYRSFEELAWRPAPNERLEDRSTREGLGPHALSEWRESLAFHRRCREVELELRSANEAIARASELLSTLAPDSPKRR